MPGGMEQTTVTRSEAETEALGASLWKTLRAGACIALDAPLGTGKTAFARGLIRAGCGAEEVPSPSFAIVQPYEGTPPLYHLDLYRLNDPSELEELGLDDMLDTGVVLIEWPEKAEGWLPADRLRVTGRMLPDGAREWRFRRG